MIKNRSLVKVILLSIVTFGIYGLIWTHYLAKDTNAICEGDGKKTAGLLKLFLLSLITFGIYSIIWIYMLGDRLQDNGPKYNVTIKESGGTILLWYLVGSFIIVGPYVALYIIIKNINALAEEYNKKLPAQS